MKKLTYKLVVITLMTPGFSSQGYGQAGQEVGSWFVYNGFYNFNPKFELFPESQLRTYETLGNAQIFFSQANSR